MKLMIGPGINNNKVRLDFRNSPDKPNNIPSYEIESSKADEFVKEYNNQTESLHKMTNTIMGLSGIIGLTATVKFLLFSQQNRILKGIASFISAVFAGALISIAVSADKKNKLMDKYDVQKYQE